MEEYKLRDVKCPFYLSKQGEPKIIKCEGLIKNSSTHIVFRGYKDPYLKQFCCNHFRECVVYKMLDSKYD
jgi:hypothetical protein